MILIAVKCTNYTASFDYDKMGFTCENRYQRNRKLPDECQKICEENHMNDRRGRGGCYWYPLGKNNNFCVSGTAPINPCHIFTSCTVFTLKNYVFITNCQFVLTTGSWRLFYNCLLEDFLSFRQL